MIFIIRYVSKDALEENEIHQNVTAEMEKFEKISSKKETKSSKKARYKKTTEREIKLNTGELHEPFKGSCRKFWI